MKWDPECKMVTSILDFWRYFKGLYLRLNWIWSSHLDRCPALSLRGKEATQLPNCSTAKPPLLNLATSLYPSAGAALVLTQDSQWVSSWWLVNIHIQHCASLRCHLLFLFPLPLMCDFSHSYIYKHLWFAKHREAKVPAVMEKITLNYDRERQYRGLVQDTSYGIRSTWS